MLDLKYSSHFKKDLKSLAKNKDLLLELENVLDILISEQKLPVQNKKHQLKGEFKGCFECHIKPDVLLIYKKDKKEKTINLLRIGSHSNLF
jgi:mRNA interferase YafQ